MYHFFGAESWDMMMQYVVNYNLAGMYWIVNEVRDDTCAVRFFNDNANFISKGDVFSLSLCCHGEISFTPISRNFQLKANQCLEEIVTLVTLSSITH